MIAEKKKKEKKKKRKEKEENRREARLKRWLQIFEKRTNRKWHERKNSFKLIQANTREWSLLKIKNKNKKGIEWC